MAYIIPATEEEVKKHRSEFRRYLMTIPTWLLEIWTATAYDWRGAFYRDELNTRSGA